MVTWRTVARAGGAFLGFVGIAVAGAALYGAATGPSKLRFVEWEGPDLASSSDPEVIARGGYLARGPAHCASCHTADDRAHPEKVATAPFSGGLAFEMGPLGTRYARNLTPDPQTGIGGLTDAQLARVIRTGVLADGELSMFMATSAAELSDEDLVAVMSYLRSLPPVVHAVPRGEWSAFANVLTAFGVFVLEPRAAVGPDHVPPSDTPSVARGRYLADHAALCRSCHTAYDPVTFKPAGPPFGGGTVEPSHGTDSDHEYAPPNLTASTAGYAGRVSEDAFVARLHAGRAYATSIMPWENFATMTETDLRSIYRYLQTVPKVDLDTGPGYRLVGSYKAP